MAKRKSGVYAKPEIKSKKSYLKPKSKSKKLSNKKRKELKQKAFRRSKVLEHLQEYEENKRYNRIISDKSYLSVMTDKQLAGFKRKYGYKKRYLESKTIYKKTNARAREYLYNSYLQAEYKANKKRKRKLSKKDMKIRAQLKIENPLFFDPEKRAVLFPWNWKDWNGSVRDIVKLIWKYRTKYEVAFRHETIVVPKESPGERLSWSRSSIYIAHSRNKRIMVMNLFEDPIIDMINDLDEYQFEPLDLIEQKSEWTDEVIPVPYCPDDFIVGIFRKIWRGGKRK